MPVTLVKKRGVADDLTVINGDALSVLKTLPSGFAQCVITSPPYWGVRDYGRRKQIGLEHTLDEYLERLLSVFLEVHRTLKDSGVMWLNMGDVYSSGNRTYRAHDKKYPQRALAVRPNTPAGLKPKDLLGLPWRLAFGLQQQGWYLRTEIIWHKTNAMPESVLDRPTRSHEYLFLLTKSQKYKFSKKRLQAAAQFANRTVWAIPTTRAKINGHHASFPEKLVEICVLGATRKTDVILDPFCGTGTVGSVSLKNSRRFVGIELNAKFARFASKRAASAKPIPPV